jgi:hypothetical protein
MHRHRGRASAGWKTDSARARVEHDPLAGLPRFLPTEIAQGQATDPADWDDPQWD